MPLPAAIPFAGVAIDGAASIVLDVLVLTSLQRVLGNDVMGRAIGAVDSLVDFGWSTTSKVRWHSSWSSAWSERAG